MLWFLVPLRVFSLQLLTTTVGVDCKDPDVILRASGSVALMDPKFDDLIPYCMSGIFDAL